MSLEEWKQKYNEGVKKSKVGRKSRDVIILVLWMVGSIWMFGRFRWSLRNEILVV